MEILVTKISLHSRLEHGSSVHIRWMQIAEGIHCLGLQFLPSCLPGVKRKQPVSKPEIQPSYLLTQLLSVISPAWGQGPEYPCFHSGESHSQHGGNKKSTGQISGFRVSLQPASLESFLNFHGNFPCLPLPFLSHLNLCFEEY